MRIGQRVTSWPVRNMTGVAASSAEVADISVRRGTGKPVAMAWSPSCGSKAATHIDGVGDR